MLAIENIVLIQYQKPVNKVHLIINNNIVCLHQNADDNS